MIAEKSTTNQTQGSTTNKSGKGPVFLKKTDKVTTSIDSTPTPALSPVAERASKFVYTDDLKKALELGFITEENIILFGKGGHGKSEFTEYFFETKNIVPFVKTMGSGTTTDSLFGGIDIKKFNETGAIEYLVENSFMAHEYVVFEELFDAPDYILEQLKDILTSKIFRNGNQMYQVKTKFIVCCTNKTREDFSKNNSLAALMERFPLEYKVEWPSYTRTTYEYMFNKTFGNPNKELAFILEKLHTAGATVSPRIAVKAATILKRANGDTSVLDFIADFSGKNKTLVQTELTKFKNVAIIEESIAEINRMINEVDALSLTNLEGIKQAKVLIRKIDADTKTLKACKADDEVVRTVNSAVKQYEEFIKKTSQRITDATEV